MGTIEVPVIQGKTPKSCAVTDCDEEPKLYKDMIVDIYLCAKHANRRFAHRPKV